MLNKEIPFITKYGINLNDHCKDKLLIGRNNELRQIMQTLTKREKNSPLLVGLAGTGKTAIVHGLCNLINHGKVPNSLKNFSIYSMNINQIEAGTKFQGELESRIENILLEAKKYNDSIILFIDEIHIILSNKIANVIKPYISSGQIKCIGATTLDEYRKFIEPDTALKRRFNNIMINEPSILETISIVRGISHILKSYYAVNINDKIIQKAANWSKRYFVTFNNPDLTLELIDDTASRIKFEREVEPYKIAIVANEITDLSLELESLKLEEEQENKKIEKIKLQIENLTTTYNNMKQQWEEEKYKIEQIVDIQTKIQNTQNLITQYKLTNNFTEAGKLLYLELPKYKNQLKQLEQSNNFQYISLDMKPMDLLITISRKTGIGIEQLSYDTSSIKKLHKFLSNHIIGQPMAINHVCKQLKQVFGGFRNPNRPISIMCFAGPTGVGKTEMAKLIGEFLFNQKDCIKIINMSQYQEKHNTSALFGTSAGYVGYKEEGILTGAVRTRPYCIILLDEMEKASPNIIDSLLAIFDSGLIEDNAGRISNFREAIIIMTINIYTQNNTANDEEQTQSNLLQELTNFFRPEFIGRINAIVKFNNIHPQYYHQIVYNHVQEEIQAFKQNTGIDVMIDDKVYLHISSKYIKTTLGVRQIRNTLQNILYSQIIDHACDMNEKQKKEKFIHVYIQDNKIYITSEKKYTS